MAVDIPGGLTPSSAQSKADFKYYLKQIFDELKHVASVGRVNSRLNCSNTQQAIPVWVGSHEDDYIVKDRGFEADDVRFARVNRSKVYAETVTDPKGGIHVRDWTHGFLEKDQDVWGPGQAFGPRAGCMYQLYIAIRIKEGDHYRHVGTITTGFRDKPDNKVEDILKRWANEEQGSAYVKFLKDNFNLGGPIF